jgi:glycosyltransferase involved in cell wall biosynthesis
MMNVAIVVATCGEDRWQKLAHERAWPTAMAEATARPGRTADLRHYDGLTIAEARNRAAAQVVAPHDWLCFLDADDELEPGYLDAMEEAWINGAITTDWSPLFVPAMRRVEPPHPWAQFEATIPNKGGWPRVNECVIGTLVHRGLFDRVGGFRTETNDGTPISIYEDWDLWLRCVDAGATRVYVPAAVYRAHVNPSGGRNVAPDPVPVYDAIWRDHLRRNDADSGA